MKTKPILALLLRNGGTLARVFDDRRLIVPTLYKVVLFSLFTLAFEVLEHVIKRFSQRKRPAWFVSGNF
jgi:hypothetical protein